MIEENESDESDESAIRKMSTPVLLAVIYDEI